MQESQENCSTLRIGLPGVVQEQLGPRSTVLSRDGPAYMGHFSRINECLEQIHRFNTSHAWSVVSARHILFFTDASTIFIEHGVIPMRS